MNIGVRKTACLVNITRRAFHLSSSRYSDNQIKKTRLHSLHEGNGGKMVEFGGYSMPVLYKDLSITDSHLTTREKCSIFDVSHMLQTVVRGKDRIEFIESLTVADVQGLQENQGSLTLFTNDTGGIIDDLIVTKTSNDYLYVVSNAGCRDKDLQLMHTQLDAFKRRGKDVTLEHLDDTFSLIALQGPTAQKVLQKLVKYNVSEQYFMFSRLADVCGTQCRITRCGYTGEDGFEISIPNDKVVEVVETLLASTESKVSLAGLGARDSLRLEAGLCLYGNDIDENTTPVEAALTWTIGKARRQRADFKGASIILKQLKESPPTKKRVGLRAISGGAPARSKVKVIHHESKQEIGTVTSGCPSPSLKQNIAMAYVSTEASKIGTKVICEIRGKHHEYEVTKMPFIPSKYFMPPKK
ncbi:aminomethyltransferase-like isoform X1 [Leptotrombidium deliense]|uniref:Aminomethyltransferase n=1 Tax=Leptotrombidium deliense TaxID=299467 RepID=A0A443SKC4_9ACAR|nr:aminomethyltransferase-like isoform X1 [Leptotrombidium deliense]